MDKRTIDWREPAREPPRVRAKAEPDRTSAVLTLIHENRRFAGTGGVSHANRDQGFRPAFRDRCTGAVYPSCYANGRPAAIHLFDSLPGELVERRDARGQVTAVSALVESGFLRDGHFFTRAEAAAAVRHDTESRDDLFADQGGLT